MGELFPCNFCDYKATTKYYLPIHIQAKHEGKKFFCDTCEKKCSNKSYLLKHKKTAHGGPSLRNKRNTNAQLVVKSLIKLYVMLSIL